MSNPLFERDDEANTPLEAEEREQLIPAYITIRAELNEAEGVNIGEAMRWLRNRKHSVLDQSYLEERRAAWERPWSGLNFQATCRSPAI